ncbi:MAG TPA: methionine--tRNA ligase [Elusimicrobiota bacterium]|nr:methionine--tRNA ligase [Elusimicrobiota bacterium]
MTKKYYLTTPLYYVNAAPHIGHAYTTVAADVLARFMRQRGKSVHFLTGTDEHGAKIEKVAQEAGVSPQAYADKISAEFRELWAHLDVHYDDFIRTTEERHVAAVRKAFQALLKSGDIFKGRYEGFYCVSDETYWTKTEAPEDAKGRRLCPNPECRRPLETVQEDSYFFRLSRYQEKLLALYRDNPGFLMPTSRAPEILRFVEGGLQDISVSRTKVKWGIPVPGDEEHTIYVWFDALLNYASAVWDGPAPSPEFWPADVHIVGKEIYRFHAVIWPAMLMALGAPPPRRVFAHGWWTVEGEKMSKSKGNFVDPRHITAEFGVDALRYFLLREMPFGNDGDFSREAMKKRYNAELANDLGNLVNRTVDMVDRFLGGELPTKESAVPLSFLKNSPEKIEEALADNLENLGFSAALASIWSVIGELNAYINAESPWKIAKTDPERTRRVLFGLVQALRRVAGWLGPFMPQTAAKIQAQLGVRQFPAPLSAEEVLAGAEKGIGKIQKAPPLFPRKP